MRKVKWGIIGAGGIADRRTIPGLLLADNAELFAVMEIYQAFSEELAKKHGAKHAYSSVEELIGNPEIDAVYIASPVTAHYEQTKKAALAGKHILLEKPLALTVAQGQELIDLCEKQNVLFASGLMMRFHAYHQKAKELVAEGLLGTIVSARAQLTCWYPDMPGSWRQSLAQAGGGALMDMGVHCIDLLQYIIDDKVASVSALVGTKTFAYEVEDSATVLMQFKNGAYATVDSNFNIPDNAAECRLELYGTKGSILASGTISQVEGGALHLFLAQDSEYSAIQDRSNTGEVPVDVTFGNMYTKEVVSFGDSILNGTPVMVPATDALQVQKVVDGAYQSAKEGRRIYC